VSTNKIQPPAGQESKPLPIVPVGLSDPKTVLDPPELLGLGTDDPDPPEIGVTPVGAAPIPVDPVDPVTMPDAGFRPEAELHYPEQIQGHVCAMQVT